MIILYKTRNAHHGPDSAQSISEVASGDDGVLYKRRLAKATASQLIILHLQPRRARFPLHVPPGIEDTPGQR